MEERIIDDPRKIKVKRNVAGGVEDATDALADEAERSVGEEEIALELPETDEYDEDLVGLTPSQLKAALEQRERAAQEAREERDKLLREGRKEREAGNFAGAEPYFVQATVYDPDCLEAKEGIWCCRTREFKDLAPLYELANAKEIADSGDGLKAFVRERAGERLRADREEYEREVAPLRETFAGAQNERREAFRKNRDYYLVRFGICFGVFLLFVLAAGVSAYFIVRTMSVLPIALVGTFGGLALIALIAALVYAHKLYVAQRLCSDNEKLSTTGEGARLSELEGRLLCLKLLLDDGDD